MVETGLSETRAEKGKPGFCLFWAAGHTGVLEGLCGRIPEPDSSQQAQHGHRHDVVCGELGQPG